MSACYTFEFHWWTLNYFMKEQARFDLQNSLCVEFLRLCMLVERYCMLVFSSFDRGIRPTRAKAPAKLYDFAFLICKFSNSCLSKYYSILLQLTVIRQGVSFGFKQIYDIFSALFQIYDIVIVHCTKFQEISNSAFLHTWANVWPKLLYWLLIRIFYIVQGSGPLTSCYFLLIFGQNRT